MEAASRWPEQESDVPARPALPPEASAISIHDLPLPTRFFAEVCSFLKLGGKLLVQEGNSSVPMRVMLNLMRIEGYSYDVNVFHAKAPANDLRDLWSGNNALFNMLLDDTKRFHKKVPVIRVIEQGFGEMLVYLARGVVTAKTFLVLLPR